MFGTSLHWTTFFYLLVDVFIVLFAIFQSKRIRHNNLNRFIVLGLLFIFYNLTGGLLPINNFPGPFILQYIITYGVAIAMCVYVVQYLYNEYDIVFLKFHLTVTNIACYVVGCFVILFLTPYFFTNSIDLGRVYFSIPVSAICLYICWAFSRRISNLPNANTHIVRRNKLSLLTITCIAILPILTVIGDYQWLTFSVINLAFYTITAIEIDRYLYLLEHKSKLDQVLLFYQDNQEKFLKPKFLNKGLTRREIEITMSILDRRTYKVIGDDFCIAESTVSKHASNIFKKMNVKSRAEFETRFISKK
ncbi:LuxR C-terminal-related transcriptional regulator [uncultured Maribacter sp.]|uniref:response regulator transcription factor n=1 Tax=uncultured Maribacter sp. TaxID=431308 RepID=UPI00261BF075|nr:LuxR C-terminal-related transcriptional regulator [uncultured Maribacter sp.]